MTTSTRHRHTRVHAAAGRGGVIVAGRRRARMSGSGRRELSPAVRAALAAYVPGTVLKAGSRELNDAEIWTLVLASRPGAPRLVRDGGR